MGILVFRILMIVAVLYFCKIILFPKSEQKNTNQTIKGASNCPKCNGKGYWRLRGYVNSCNRCQGNGTLSNQ